MDPQLVAFLALTVSGILWGLTFEIFRSIRVLFKDAIWCVIICDLLASLVGGAFFFIASLTYANLEIRFHLILGFAIGFAIERLSLGHLLAKNLSLVYNAIGSGLKKLKDSRLLKKFFK